MRGPLLGALAALALASGLVAVSDARRAHATPSQSAPVAAADDPRAVVRAATRAVRADSAAPLRARWVARLRADSTDRAAALGLATLARLEYDYSDADRRYRRLFEGASADDHYAVYAQLGLAQGKDAQGQMHQREELLRAARAGARALGDAAAEGEALLWLAHSLAPVYGGAFALAHADSALRVLPAADGGLRAAARCRRAQILTVIRRPNAGDALRTAIAAADDARAEEAQGFCLRALAVEFQIAGNTDSMDVVLRRLEALRRRMRDRPGLALALGMRFELARAVGDFGAAMPLASEALAEARASNNTFMQATSSLMMGSLMLALNDHRAAGQNVERAVAAFEAADDSGSAMLARSFRPFVSMAAGDLTRARREVLEVTDWARGVGDWGHLTELQRQLANIAMRQGDWVAAERALDEATDIVRRHRIATESGTLLFDRGRLALYRGDYAVAEREIGRYLAQLDPEQRLSRHEARTHLADVYARRGDLDRAERELRLAGDELDTWRASLADRDVRLMAFQSSVFEVNDRNASVARVLAALAATGRADAAFELAERRRARELAERLVRVHALHAAGDSAAASPVRLRGASHPADAPSAGLAAAVAAAIPDERTAVLEYVTGVMGAPTTLFVLTRHAGGAGASAVRGHALARADSLVDDVARFVALVEGGGDPEALGRALGATLLDSALAALPPAVTRLVVVPDGPLHRVPWDALRLADGRYLAQRYAVSVAPSATVLAELWRRARERKAADARPVRVLAYGDPAFADERAASGEEADVYRSAFDSTGGLPRLRASADEARLVARYGADAEVRLREAASAAYLKRAPLERFRVLHLATHALVDERAMTRTALALAPGEGESGFVGPGDLAALALDADLVVLSACRSAGGVVVDGEGVQGLTAPLLAAGARAVVATGWRIGDRSTVAFVDDFYDAMARGLPVGEALRAAKLAAIARGAPPREWAAFMAVGDPLVTIPLLTPTPLAGRWWVAALAALGAAGLAVAYWLRMRRRRTAEAR